MSASLTHLHELKLEAVEHEAATHEWVFIFAAGVTVRVSSPWRVRVDDRVAAGWEDHDSSRGPAQAATLVIRTP
jgi:hypothetical protein